MSGPKYSPDYDYEEYDSYSERELTNIGLPPGQLALIIGVNAVISLIIAVVVVLVANRQVIPGDVATPADSQTTPAATVGGQVDLPASEPAAPGDEQAAEQQAEATPVESVTYEVQAGDTLTVIADKFSVSLFDLMVVNGLTDEDFIQVGQVLEIPLGGLPDATPTFTPVPIPTDTPLPFDPPTPLPEGANPPAEPAATVGPSPTPTQTPITATNQSALPTSTPPPADEINVIISEVVGAGDLAQESLIVLNQGPGVGLLDWRLEGSSLGSFVFPDIFLFSGGSIRIHTAAGQNTPSDLYLGQGEAAWPPGTTIILRDTDGNEITSFAVPGGGP